MLLTEEDQHPAGLGRIVWLRVQTLSVVLTNGLLEGVRRGSRRDSLAEAAYERILVSDTHRNRLKCR